MINFAKGRSTSRSTTGNLKLWQGSYRKFVTKYTKRWELTICHYTHLQICYLADLQIKRKPPTYSALADFPEGGRLQNAPT